MLVGFHVAMLHYRYRPCLVITVVYIVVVVIGMLRIWPAAMELLLMVVEFDEDDFGSAM